jgi:large subunit ribosomal protein L9
MEVILREDIDNVGLRGEVVNVARGYARNYLFPRKLAQAATPALVKELEKRQAQLARHEAATVDQAREIASTLEGAELRFDVKAGPTGSLFGSVTPTDIADEIWAKHKIRVDRRKMGIDTIKRIGRYGVPIDLFQDVRVEVRILVVPEGGELPSDAELEAMEAEERKADEAEPAREGPALEELIEAEDELVAAAAEPAADAAPEPDWRADADAALRQE